MCKVGISASVKSRLASLQTAGPFALELMDQWELPSRLLAEKLERSAHEILAQYRAMGEWFCMDESFAKTLIDDCLCIEAIEAWGMTGNWVRDYFLQKGLEADHARDIVLANFGEEAFA